jgi:hypothetical protein
MMENQESENVLKTTSDKNVFDQASALWISLQESKSLLEMQRRGAARQTLSVLGCGLSALLCVRDNENSRDDSTLRRALLGIDVLLSHCQTIQTEKYGQNSCAPLLVVSRLRDIPIWETALTVASKNHCLNVQLIPYWGQETDRITARSFLAHQISGQQYIVLCSYESLLLDAHLLREVHWQCVTMDEPWGLLCNTSMNHTAVAVLLSQYCRQRLLLCSNILRSFSQVFNDVDGDSKVAEKGGGNVLPDCVATLLTLCPFALGLPMMQAFTVEDAQQDKIIMSVTPSLSLSDLAFSLPSNGKGRERLLFDAHALGIAARLCAALTIVCDADLASLARSQSSLLSDVNDVDCHSQCTSERERLSKELDTLSLVVAALEWRGIERTYADQYSDDTQRFQLHTASSLFNSLHFEIRERVNTVQQDRDTELSSELRHVVLAAVGKHYSGPRYLVSNNDVNFRKSLEQPGRGRGRGGKSLLPMGSSCIIDVGLLFAGRGRKLIVGEVISSVGKSLVHTCVVMFYFCCLCLVRTNKFTANYWWC